MSEHNYTPYANPEVEHLLQDLLFPSTLAPRYRQLMTELGQHLATVAKAQIPQQHHVHIVCTVEDADFLANGILSTLQTDFPQINLSCFWNHRQKIGGHVLNVNYFYRKNDNYSYRFSPFC